MNKKAIIGCTDENVQKAVLPAQRYVYWELCASLHTFCAAVRDKMYVNGKNGFSHSASDECHL